MWTKKKQQKTLKYVLPQKPNFMHHAVKNQVQVQVQAMSHNVLRLKVVLDEERR